MNNNSVIVKESGNLMGDSVIVNGDRFDIRSVIYTIRGVQVMLDRDLAAAYQVTTSVFNQAVKRNANRFPEGFRFLLSKEENDVLISQIVTSKRNSLWRSSFNGFSRKERKVRKGVGMGRWVSAGARPRTPGCRGNRFAIMTPPRCAMA